ncbi:MAG: hypothetical protein WDW38_008494 [Sanguina aurantia]
MDASYPNPVFEGSEKRIEICFSSSATAPTNGLRALPREHLDELMTLAACCIVSNRSNDYLDAYVLSESSLFVYPQKWVLKTCGTTRLLNAVPRLLELAASIGMTPRRCKFSRASFLFPDEQLFPHTSFEHEVEFLQAHCGALLGGGQAYLLGEPHAGLQWHVYIAEDATPAPSPTFNLEVVMTELHADKAVQFVRTESFVSAVHTTASCGIGAIKPGATVDDFMFEPCGYSMNGIEGSGLMTIHITPEEGQSYASVEISGHASDLQCPTALLASVVAIFQPGRMAVALSVDSVCDLTPAGWGQLSAVPSGYSCSGAATQAHGKAGRVCFYTLAGPAAVQQQRLHVVESADNKIAPGSPNTVCGNNASFLSVATSSDSDADNGSDGGDVAVLEAFAAPVMV